MAWLGNQPNQIITNFYQTKNSQRPVEMDSKEITIQLQEQLTGMKALASSPSLLTSAHVFSVPLFYLSKPLLSYR